MSLQNPPRERWSITPEAFQRLLQRLHPDPERAGELFQSLHSKLVLYFTYNRCSNAESWADETLDRVAKRLVEEQPIADLTAFARGVARLVLLEAQKQQQREREVLLAVQHIPAPAHDERALRCLDSCLAALLPGNRDLISRYYSSRDSARIAARRKLAEQLGITVDALRTRALRIRRELELCVTRCREKGERPS